MANNRINNKEPARTVHAGGEPLEKQLKIKCNNEKIQK